MNLYLIGYRGTGKTTLGKILSTKLKLKFADMDSLIEKRENRSIEEIFSIEGEDYFRKLEQNILVELSRDNNLVVSTGGGVVLMPENRKIIRSTGLAIYLTSDEKTIYDRIKNDKNRPPLTSKPLLEEIKDIYAQRKPLYEEIADITIETSIYDVEECIERIIEFLEKRGFFV